MHNYKNFLKLFLFCKKYTIIVKNWQRGKRLTKKSTNQKKSL